MPINLSQIRNELLPGLFDVRGQYERIPTQFGKVFTKKNATMAVERSTQMRLLGLPQLKDEGTTFAFDNNAGERFTWNFEAYEVGLGFAVTRKVIEDNLYKTMFDPTKLNLLEVFKQYKEIQAANIINNGATYNANLGGDGKALFATDHPYDGGSWSNRPSTDLDLNEASLLSAQVNVPATFVDEAGVRILATAEKLVVPRQLQPVAHRLIHAELRPGTASNDPNVVGVIGHNNQGIKEYVVMDFLSSSYAWFVTTSEQRNGGGLIYMERAPFETTLWVDDWTDNLLCKGRERYTFGHNDPRAVYGTFPTS